MFKKLYLFTIFILICNANYSFAVVPVNCCPELQSSLASIQKIPEARKLIDAIQKEGPITIMLRNTELSDEFGAFWDGDRRIIAISSRQSPGARIGSILFELHNASVSSKLNHLDTLAETGKIDRDSYVESVEYLEYRNSIGASTIAEKGIKMGIFPKEARLPVYKNFEEHFYYQKIGGHSSWIAKNYDQLTSRFYRRPPTTNSYRM